MAAKKDAEGKRVSQLCKPLWDILHDQTPLSVLEYLVQFMDTRNSLHLLQFWFSVASFRKATSSGLSGANKSLPNTVASSSHCEEEAQNCSGVERRSQEQINDVPKVDSLANEPVPSDKLVSESSCQTHLQQRNNYLLRGETLSLSERDGKMMAGSRSYKRGQVPQVLERQTSLSKSLVHLVQ